MVAGVVLAAATSQALVLDGQITIAKALNSPTLTVRYTNAAAALVELRVNGESVATRSVDAGRRAGETNFTLNLDDLARGDNQVEVRLFDKAGKLLASEQTTVAAGSNQGPIFITNPRMGATVRGAVEIKVGFGKEMKNSYVSFFIDNQFKSISNVPPFNFNWDTSRDSNGWHEVEAWVVDDASATYKTRKVRVFVDNPSGATPRHGLPTPVAPPTTATPVLPNPVGSKVSGAAGPKPATTTGAVATGPQAMLPTGKRQAIAPRLKTPIANVIKTAPTAAGMIAIAKGARLPNTGAFAIVYNTQFVDFDVQPRVESGVPLTPFRYLIEKAGGKVDWQNAKKNVTAQADGRSIFLHIGDSFARIDQQRVDLERASFIDRGRTIVPLSFMKDALNVEIQYDKATGHVLITSARK